MYEKQSLLETTKSGITELVRRKASARGADPLRDELAAVTSRWQTLGDRCRQAIRLCELLRDFFDAHDQLASWLGSKDKLITALGPIASDSRMVQSQQIQVQVSSFFLLFFFFLIEPIISW